MTFYEKAGFTSGARLRTAAILLFAVIFSFVAIPLIVSKLPEKAVDFISDHIKGSVGYDREDDVGFTVYTENVSQSAGQESMTEPYETAGDKSGATAPDETETESEAAPETKKVRAVNLSRNDPADEQKLHLMNETDYNVDLKEYADRDYDFALPDGASPLVLVIHTHGTEAYLPDGTDTYDRNTKYRSTDSSYNVVGIGSVFCSVLEQNGISTVHDVTMHDLDDFNAAYASSREAMKEYLKEYPTISYIIDIHRDTVFTKDGENQKPVASIGGKTAAQVMIVVGTDAAGAAHPYWGDNLTLAAKLQKAFNEYPAFARPVYLRRSSFNQQVSRGALILEIGSCGNTVSEAREAAVLAATQFAKLIKRDG